MSAALHRLRRQFGDQLLVRSGAQAELTPLGVQLQPLTAAALASVERVFTSTAVFDPAVLEPRVHPVQHRPLGRLGRRGARGTGRPRSAGGPAAVRPAERRAVRRDHGRAAHRGRRDRPTRRAARRRPYGLYSDDWVCLVDAGNRRVGERLDPAELSTLPWAVAVNESTADAGLRSEPLGMRQLRQAGVEPRIAATVESYLAVPWFVAGTERIAIAHRRFAEQIAGVMDLRVLDCPIPLRPMKVALWWHPQFEGDAGHRWLRETLRALCDESQNAETR